MWFGDPWFTLLVLAVTLLASWEFNRLAKAAGGDPLPLLAPASAALIVLDARLHTGYTPAIVTGTLVLSLVWSVVRYQEQGSRFGWLWTLGAAFYTGWLLSYYASLRSVDQGREWILLALLGTFVNDTAAYAVGRWLGRNRMAPGVSPGKTWEGALGGLIATSLIIPLLAMLLGLSWSWTILGLGVALSIAAQIGDLVESMLKRSSGLKDTSQLVPGHGGILDRLDSLVFVGPLVYYYVLWIPVVR